jgi:hypothetical protein
MSGIRPNLPDQAGFSMSVDRGRPEVSAIRSNRRDQPITDVGYGSRAAVAGRLMAQPVYSQLRK